MVTNSSPNPVHALPDSSQDDAVEIDLFQLMLAILRRWKLVVGICGTAILAALVYCFATTPAYQATGQVLTERMNGNQINTLINLVKTDGFLKQVQNGLVQSGISAQNVALSGRVVAKQVPKTNLIEISFRDKDPKFAADVVNRIAEELVNEVGNKEQLENEQLKKELADIETQHFAAIAKVNEFRKKHNIASIEVSRGLLSEQINTLYKQLAEAREAVINQEITVKALDEAVKSGKNLDALPVLVHDKTLASLKIKRVEALANLLGDNRTADRPTLSQKHLLEMIDKAISKEQANILASQTANLEAARARSNLLEQEWLKANESLSDLELVAEEFKLLNTNLELSSITYQKVLAKVADLTLAQKTSFANNQVQLVGPAGVPSRPAFPPKAKILIIVTLAAGVLSVLLCVLLELLDGSVKNRQDLERSGRLPLVGVIPNIPHPGDKRAGFACHDAPSGTVAEAFRNLRTTLTLSDSFRTAKLFAVSSAVPDEGHSAVALNLATSYAQAGKRTLLIDADLRTRTLSAALLKSIPNQTGLTSLLAGEIAPDQVNSILARPFEALPLEFLGSGSNVLNPAELLAAERTSALLASLAKDYDIVIVDTAPILAFSDTPSMACVPGMMFLMVGRLYQTQKKDLTGAVEKLADVNGALAGTIVLQGRKGQVGDFDFSYGGKSMPWYKRLI